MSTYRQIILFVIYILRVSNQTEPKRPFNIVFILADDLGYNDVPWNNPNIDAPNLKQLYRNSINIPNYYTSPLCNPSRAALMTGRYQYNTLMPGLSTETPAGLSTRFKLMPQYFKAMGYSTHMLGKWHLGYCHEDFLPTRRGFDSFYGFLNGAEDHFTHETDVKGGGKIYDFFKDEEVDFSARGYYTDGLLASRAAEIITNSSTNADNPFLLFVAAQNIHAPLQYPPGSRDFGGKTEDFIRRKALSMIFSLDQMVGRILQAVRREGGEENTIIVFTSDNGGEVVAGGNNFPLSGGKRTLWEGGIRVPALLHLPGLAKRTYTGLFHVTDWLPTLMDAATASLNLAARDLDGVSHFAAMTSDIERPPRDEIFKRSSNNGGILRKGRHKLVVGDHCCKYRVRPEETVRFRQDQKTFEEQADSLAFGDVEKRPVWVFDIDADPEEKRNLASDNPSLTRSLLARFDQILAAISTQHRQKTANDTFSRGFERGIGVVQTGWCQSQ